MTVLGVDPAAIPAQDLTEEGSAGAGPDVGAAAGDAVVAEQAALSPTEVRPPIPSQSLLLTFAFVIPMNLVSQACAGSLLASRIRRRGLLPLSAPLRPGAILAGRLLPYAVAGLAVWGVVSALLGLGATGWAAAFVVVAAPLAAGLVLGLVSRSERELTFLMAGATTLLSVFLFLPAVFRSLPPIAFLSPVRVIDAALHAEYVPVGAFLYATVPLAAGSLGLTVLGFALYREETLFAPRDLWTKLSQGLARVTRSLPAGAGAAVAVVPFAFAAELLVLSLVIPLGLRAVLPGVLLGAAAVEEGLKRGVMSALWRARPGRSRLAIAAVVGTGFFIGEKLAFILTLVGFASLEMGPETLRAFGVAGDPWLALLPLGLHVGACMVAAIGVGRTRAAAWLAWAAATLVHAAYNAVAAIGVAP